MSSWGVNPRAAEKRQRQKDKKQQEARKREQQKERSKWKDEQTQKHLNKKKEKERDAYQEQRKKEEKKKLLEEQEREMAKYSKKGAPEVKKLTVAEIAARQIKAMGLNIVNSDDEEPEENPNTEITEQVKANNVEEALEQLQLGDRADKHPEKRMKAAWNIYLEQNLPRIKQEYPNQKRSQHIEMLQEEWKKSPQNPFNRNIANYNEKV